MTPGSRADGERMERESKREREQERERGVEREEEEEEEVGRQFECAPREARED